VQLNQPIAIPFSRKKLLIRLVLAIGFVACGFWFILYPHTFKSTKLGNPILVFGTGILLILFFGLGAFYLLLKFFDNKPGLIIDHDGLIDRSTGVAIGRILWSDITNILILPIYKDLIMIEVKDPQTYINRETNILKKIAMRISAGMHKSPVHISSGTLQIELVELHRILTQHLKVSK
jgi:hypothetical protein